MRKILKASSLLICAMLLFSACASSLNLRPGPFRSEMQDVFVQQTTLAVPASHAEHGEAVRVLAFVRTKALLADAGAINKCKLDFL